MLANEEYVSTVANALSKKIDSEIEKAKDIYYQIKVGQQDDGNYISDKSYMDIRTAIESQKTCYVTLDSDPSVRYWFTRINDNKLYFESSIQGVVTTFSLDIENGWAKVRDAVGSLSVITLTEDTSIHAAARAASTNPFAIAPSNMYRLTFGTKGASEALIKAETYLSTYNVMSGIPFVSQTDIGHGHQMYKIHDAYGNVVQAVYNSNGGYLQTFYIQNLSSKLDVVTLTKNTTIQTLSYEGFSNPFAIAPSSQYTVDFGGSFLNDDIKNRCDNYLSQYPLGQYGASSVIWSQHADGTTYTIRDAFGNTVQIIMRSDNSVVQFGSYDEITKPFTINILDGQSTESGLSSDKTFAEIKAAFEVGRSVYAVWHGGVSAQGWLGSVDGNEQVSFEFSGSYSDPDTIFDSFVWNNTWSDIVIIQSNNTVQVWNDDITIPPYLDIEFLYTHDDGAITTNLCVGFLERTLYTGYPYMPMLMLDDNPYLYSLAQVDISGSKVKFVSVAEDTIRTLTATITPATDGSSESTASWEYSETPVDDCYIITLKYNPATGNYVSDEIWSSIVSLSEKYKLLAVRYDGYLLFHTVMCHGNHGSPIPTFSGFIQIGDGVRYVEVSIADSTSWMIEDKKLVSYSGDMLPNKFFGTDTSGNWILKDAPAASDTLEVHFVSTRVQLARGVGGNITWTCDKTYEEIQAANEAEAEIRAFIDGCAAPLIYCDPHQISFGFINSDNVSTFITYSKEINVEAAESADGTETQAKYTITLSDRTYVTTPIGVLRDGVLTTNDEGDWSMTPMSRFDSLGLTSATVGQTIKVKAVDDSGRPVEWEAVDDKDVWETIGEIDITTDVSNGVHSWTFDDLPGYKELVIDRDSLIGQTETASGLTFRLNDESYSGQGGWVPYQKTGQYSGSGYTIIKCFAGYLKAEIAPMANNHTNYATGSIGTSYNLAPFNHESITKITVSDNALYPILSGKITIKGLRA